MGKYQTDKIGGISNYYGGLGILAEEGKFYWSLEDWNGYNWKEIPEEFYNTLKQFNTDYKNNG